MKRWSIALSAGLVSAGYGLPADDAEHKPEELFKQLDQDANGTLGKDEVPENQLRFYERLVRVGDKNEDGQLSQDEFAAAMKEEEPQADPRPAEGGRPGFGPPGGRPPFRQRDVRAAGRQQRRQGHEGRVAGGGS